MYYGDSKKQSRSYCRERTSPLPPLQKGEYKVSGNPPFEGGAHRAGDVILPIALRRTGK